LGRKTQISDTKVLLYRNQLGGKKETFYYSTAELSEGRAASVNANGVEKEKGGTIDISQMLISMRRYQRSYYA